MSYIKIDNVVKKFGEKTVIKGISLEFEKGEFISFLGSSGCGKTTMLRMIAGFEEPTSGRIEIDGKVLYSDKDNIMLPPGKRNLGMVFQSYAVWPHMNLFDNVAYPLKIQKVDKAEIERRTMEMLDVVGLAGREKEYPWAFSGGQQQRIALARALVMQPSVLLLDEPLSNLDAHLRDKMKEEIRNIQKRMNITVIYVTHDQSEALQMSDKIVILNGGEVEQIAGPTEIYHEPKTPFVAGFVGKNNIFEYQGKTIAVRPENLLVSEEKPDAFDRIQATVSHTIFQGTHYFAHFESEYGHMMAQVPADMILSDGQQVWLSWNKCNTF